MPLPDPASHRGRPILRLAEKKSHSSLAFERVALRCTLGARLKYFCLVGVVLLSIGRSQAEEIPFPNEGNVSDRFFVTKGAAATMAFSGEGHLSYVPPVDGQPGGTHLTLLTEGGSDLYTEAKKVSISLRLSTGASFGVAVKGAERTSDSYLFLIQTSGKQHGVLRICKAPMLPLSNTVLDHQLNAHAFTGYDSAAWHRLVLTLKEADDAVVMEAQILREDGTEVASVVTRDASGALTGKGLFGMRFFMPPQASDGFEEQPPLLQVKDLSIDPAPSL